MKSTTKRNIAIGTTIAIIVAAVTTLLPGEPAPVGAFGAGNNWTLVFRDEFDGINVDLTKWTPNWLGSNVSITPPINTSELSCYAPANVMVSGGALVLTAKASTLGTACRTRSTTAAYSSGMVQSNGKYNTAYGYFEARIWNPAGIDHQSVWPAFWTDGQNWPTTGEIDIMECYGTDSSCSYHYHYSGGGPGGNSTVVGSTTGWHVYAAYWEPGRITWFYDGVKIASMTQGIVSAPHYIILNLGVIGNQVIIPSQMLVDYVRVWKIAAGTPVPTLSQTAIPPSKTPTATFIPSFTVTPSLAPPVATGTPSSTPTTIVNPSFTPIPSTATPSITPTRTITPTPTYECLLFPVHAQRVCLP